jgi:hypothetical protein
VNVLTSIVTVSSRTYLHLSVLDVFSFIVICINLSRCQSSLCVVSLRLLYSWNSWFLP